MTLIDGTAAAPRRHEDRDPRPAQGLRPQARPARARPRHPGRPLAGVIGGSGTGKSVLIKCVQALVEPDSGSIRVDGDEVVRADSATMARVRAKFGMLFQGGALFDSLPVWENVAFGLLASRRVTSRKEARSRRSPRWPW
jgi:ABC-type molybdate transport system ATPase subunit